MGTLAKACAARRAREQIVDFVREHLPEGSALAFTVGELRALDATRSSRQRFEPYGRRAGD
jgi:O-methyltransferase involved in polyketide biosynthesis